MKLDLRGAFWFVWLFSLGAIPALAVESFDVSAAIRAAIDTLETQHLQGGPLDPPLATRWHANFLIELDPRRMYFLQDDVEELRPHADYSEDPRRHSDFRTATAVRDRFSLRVREALAMAEACLKQESDFAIKEQCPRSYESYAATKQELQERWRLQIKRELLREKHQGRTIPSVAAEIDARARRVVRQASEMTDERLCTCFLTAAAASYDPHSCYFGPSFLSSLDMPFAARHYRLGLELHSESGTYLVKSVDSRLGPTARRWIGWHVIAI